MDWVLSLSPLAKGELGGLTGKFNIEKNPATETYTGHNSSPSLLQGACQPVGRKWIL